jgi:hypothetical protein
MKVSHLAPHSSLQYGADLIKSTQKFDIQPMSYLHMPEGLHVQGLSCRQDTGKILFRKI